MGTVIKRLARIRRQSIVVRHVNTLRKIIRTEYRDSQYIADIREPVEGVCKILDKHYSSHYERYKYTADYMGNIIGFWNKLFRDSNLKCRNSI